MPQGQEQPESPVADTAEPLALRDPAEAQRKRRGLALGAGLGQDHGDPP